MQTLTVEGALVTVTLLLLRKLDRCGGASIHLCIWKAEDSGGSLESRSCELAW